ncbi:hypothetical protein BGZ80_002151 [Entomortierella chlamydospora]|uniref:F-box domain-containing protein n=1 Tax=Entomortierella chlamydospora TaxID=101097 RepID=A0A9P6MQI1_9FUNG|nr:hypothetical protein BGZ79_009998 [Entomortierella chlamydospora]KAG0009703.1 hypothetical protein BGZ80_002151 [Entomortierella chlamydospora]
MMTTETNTRCAASVFDIHFIQSQICADLTPRDLRRCCLVSWNFYHNFAPYLYRTIDIGRKSTFNKFRRPESLAALHRYRDHVTQVSCVFAQVWKLLLVHECYNLTAIKGLSLPRRPQNREVNKWATPDITKLIQVCPKLRVLELSHFLYEREVVEEFCRAIRNHGGLKELKIDHFEYVICKRVREILWSTLKLERFYLNMAVVSTQIMPDEAQTLIDLTGEEDPEFRVRYLDIPWQMYDREADMFFRYLRRCPHVERLTVPYMYPFRYAAELANIISTTMPNLQHLDVHAVHSKGEIISRLIKACNNLRSFVSSPAQELTNHVITALMKHRESLQELSFVRGTFTTSRQIQTILCSFPNLEVFDAMVPFDKMCNKNEELTRKGKGDPILNPKDLLSEQGPWICDKLRVLKLRYLDEWNCTSGKDNDDDDDDKNDYEDESQFNSDIEDGSKGVLPITLYEQIGRMTELEVLWLGRVQKSATNPVAVADMISAGDNSGFEAEQSDNDRSMGALRRREVRIKNVTKALWELRKLGKIKQLELRNLRPFISRDAIRQAKSNWRYLKRLHYS